MEDFNQLFDDHLFNIDKADSKTIKLKEGERRMVSILFADIKGFTALSEKLDHEEVQSLMDQLMKIFSHSVDIHGGYVDKYTGDQIMALFGAKKASEVDTQRAVNTALDMLQKLKKFNSILNNSPKYKSLNIDFSIRVGINTGMVTTGAIGKEREGDYTVYGDSVNLAARMESNAPINSIMIPENTMNLVGNYFEFKDHGDIKVKGKADKISVFIVESKKDLSISHTTPFIGREIEIQKLNEVYNSCIKNLSNTSFNKINIISSVADAGTGKSRLVYEFLNNNKKIKDKNTYSIGHSSNVSSQPYFLFITLLKDIFKISELDSNEAIRNKLDIKITEIESKTNKKLNNHTPFIGFLLGVKYDDNRLENREEIKNNINIAIRSLLENICEDSNRLKIPHIFVLDDLHWIDNMSLELLYFIISTFDYNSKKSNKNSYYPLFILTFRTHYSLPDKIINEANYNQINLKPLTKEDSLLLINYLSKDKNIDEDKRTELLEKSKGNPFFIEEWINLIKEKENFSEVLEESRGISEYAIPNSINALILARIDNLNKDLKTLLQKATIIGEDFFLQILSKLEEKLGFDKKIEEPIHDLENENFIQHFINQLDHYKFKHILTRDVAYSTILKSNKKILHKSVAEVIEDNFSDKLEIFYFDLAVHYDMSGNNEKAIKYLLLAGKKSFFIHNYSQSKQCFERVINIIDTNINNNVYKENDQEQLNKFYESKLFIGKILLSTGKWDESLQLLNEIKSNNNKISSRTYQNTLFAIGQLHSFKRNIKKAVEHFKISLELSKKNNDKIMEALSIGELANSALDSGQTQAALKGFEKELDIFEKIKSETNTSIAFGHLGQYYFQNGDMKTAMTFFKKKYEISSKNDSKQQILIALGNISLIHNICGEFSKSLKILDEVLSISEDINDLRNQSLTYGNRGIIYKNLGEYESSLENYYMQQEISEKMEDDFSKSNALDGIGLVYKKMKEFEKSEEMFKNSIDLKIKINDLNGHATSLNNLAESLLFMGKLEQAENHFNEALKIFKQIENHRAFNICSCEFSKLMIINDKTNDAIDTMSKSIKYFLEINDRPSINSYFPLFIKALRLSNNNNNQKELLEQVSNSINDYNTDYEIEMGINYLLEYKDDKKLREILKNQKLSDFQAGYIHYNIGAILKDDNEMIISKKLLQKEYKKFNDFNCKYYIDKLK